MATSPSSRLGAKTLSRHIGQLLLASAIVFFAYWLAGFAMPKGESRADFSEVLVPLGGLMIGQVCFNGLRALVTHNPIEESSRQPQRIVGKRIFWIFAGNLYVLWFWLFQALWLRVEGKPWAFDSATLEIMLIFWTTLSGGQVLSCWWASRGKPASRAEGERE